MTQATSQVVVNEGSDATLVTIFWDDADEPVAPASITYSVHDVKTGNETGTGTDASPTNPWELQLTPAMNTIQDSTKKMETRRVTIQATLPDGKAHNSQIEYRLKNLAHVT